MGRDKRVYPVREDTLLLKRNLMERDLENKKFLEIGVGNGENSLAVAKKGAEVTGVDINSEAVVHTRQRFKKINLIGEFFQSDLFENIQGTYDFIVFNPPYLKGEKGIGDEEMWRGGKNGVEVAENYLREVEDYLSESGCAWVVLSSSTDYNSIKEEFNLEKLDSKKLWFEEILLYRYN